MVFYNQIKSLISLSRSTKSALDNIVKNPHSVTQYIASKGIIGRRIQQMALRVTEPKHLLSGIRLKSIGPEFTSVEASLRWPLKPSDYIKMAEFSLEAFWRNFPETNHKNFVYSELKLSQHHQPQKKVYSHYTCTIVDKENFILKVMMHGRENLEFVVNFFDEQDHLCALVSGTVLFQAPTALPGSS